MALLTGSTAKVESLEQFVTIHPFSKVDVIRATRDELELIQEYNELHADEDEYERIDRLEQMYEDDVDHYFSELDVTEAIDETLKADDDQEWVHLFDGVSVHTVVEITDVERK